MFLKHWTVERENFYNTQKQTFANVLQFICSYNFRKIHSKTRLLDSLFNEDAGQRPVGLLKRYSSTSVFL